jgi:membrane protease subunit HflC
MKILIPFIVLIIAAFVVVPQALYTVDETQFVVVTRFGEIREIVETPGLKFKVPFVDTKNVLNNRILRVDVTPTSMPDTDNQFLQMDAYVRYRIEDPRKFVEKLRTEVDASSRIQDIVISALRGQVGQATQPEIIGGRLVGIGEDRTVVEPLLDDEGIPTRQAIVNRALRAANENVKSTANDFGVDIVDLRIKRADFPEATEENIFTRMRTERSVQAQKLRAEGEEIFRTRIADVDRLVEIIAAEADEEADQLRGEGEGEAIAILAVALEQDPDLFAFRRSLEAYATFLNSNTTLVLPTDSPLFQFLQDPYGSAGN